MAQALAARVLLVGAAMLAMAALLREWRHPALPGTGCQDTAELRHHHPGHGESVRCMNAL
jgi:hypothetical protein